jgi:putative ABC transport system permease protein
MQAVRRLNSWWSVSAWPSRPHEALLGVRAASLLGPKQKSFDLTFEGRTIHLDSAGTLRTGAAEDSRIYLSLADFEDWTRVLPSTIEIAVNGTPREVNAILNQIAKALPDADVHPVRQIVEAEGRVLGKTRATLLAAAVLIILTAALCVTATLTAWVLDRRRDFAIMKALGASERLVGAFFATEAAVLGAVGALTGFIVGIGVADWIGRANFHAGITPRLSVFPLVLGGSIALALLAAVVPMALLRRVQPAIMLRGE